MAVSAAILLPKGNIPHPAMVQFNMDDEVSFLADTDVGITVLTEESDGTDVNAAEAVLVTTAAVRTPKELMDDLVAAINTNIPSARAAVAKNSENEYVIRIKPIVKQAWYVTLTLPVFTPGVA